MCSCFFLKVTTRWNQNNCPRSLQLLQAVKENMFHHQYQKSHLLALSIQSMWFLLMKLICSLYRQITQSVPLHTQHGVYGRITKPSLYQLFTSLHLTNNTLHPFMSFSERLPPTVATWRKPHLASSAFLTLSKATKGNFFTPPSFLFKHHCELSISQCFKNILGEFVSLTQG